MPTKNGTEFDTLKTKEYICLGINMYLWKDRYLLHDLAQTNRAPL